MKRKNYFIAVLCGLACISGMSSCCSVMDALYGPPYHHHCPPPPPPRHHHHHHHHYRYFSDVPMETTADYDMAIAEMDGEQKNSIL